MYNYFYKGEKKNLISIHHSYIEVNSHSFFQSLLNTNKTQTQTQLNLTHNLTQHKLQ